MGAPKNYSTRSLTKADQPEIDAVLAANPMWKLKHARESVARKKFLRRCGLIQPQPESMPDFKQRIALLMRGQEGGEAYAIVGAPRANACVVRKEKTYGRNHWEAP